MTNRIALLTVKNQHYKSIIECADALSNEVCILCKYSAGAEYPGLEKRMNEYEAKKTEFNKKYPN